MKKLTNKDRAVERILKITGKIRKRGYMQIYRDLLIPIQNYMLRKYNTMQVQDTIRRYFDEMQGKAYLFKYIGDKRKFKGLYQRIK